MRRSEKKGKKIPLHFCTLCFGCIAKREWEEKIRPGSLGTKMYIQATPSVEPILDKKWIRVILKDWMEDTTAYRVRELDNEEVGYSSSRGHQEEVNCDEADNSTTSQQLSGKRAAASKGSSKKKAAKVQNAEEEEEDTNMESGSSDSSSSSLDESDESDEVMEEENEGNEDNDGAANAD